VLTRFHEVNLWANIAKCVVTCEAGKLPMSVCVMLWRFTLKNLVYFDR